jgi:RNA polymerase sigma-70 factor (ECF subfamily)
VVLTSNTARGTCRSLRSRAAERSHSLPPETADPRTTSVIAGTRLDLLDALEDLEARSPAVVEPFVLRDLGGRLGADGHPGGHRWPTTRSRS